MRRFVLTILALAGLLLRPPPLVGQSGVPMALTPFEVTRTQRMLHDRLACLGCHSVDGVGGAIGPELNGVSERLSPSDVLRMIRDPASVIPGTRMPRQPMPLREARRLAAYLVALAPGGARPPAVAEAPAPPPSGDETPEALGRKLYARHCAACHGASGGGDGWNAPNLPVPPTAHADANLMSKRPDDSLFDAIYAGAYVLDGSPRMPAFGEMLTTVEIRALVRHIRRLCDCEGPAWSRDGVGR
jgi:mono/diheme cytochrome c family protein